MNENFHTINEELQMAPASDIKLTKKPLQISRQVGETVKPTGQGTGLGLSLRYDIVKTHGRIKSGNEGREETDFIIQLPHHF